MAVSAIGRLAVVLKALELPIAKDKAKILSSSDHIAKLVAHELRTYGFEAVNQLSVLGLECRAGARLTYKAIHNRVRNIKERLPRFRKLRGLAKIAKRIARPCLAPGMTYGLHVVGAPRPCWPR